MCQQCDGGNGKGCKIVLPDRTVQNQQRGRDRVWCCREGKKAEEEGWSETMTAVSQTKNKGRESLRSPLPHFLLSLLGH